MKITIKIKMRTLEHGAARGGIEGFASAPEGDKRAAIL